jgi:predicted dehydrogenase
MLDFGCYIVHWFRSFSGSEPNVTAAKAVVGTDAVDLTMEADMEFPPAIAARLHCSMVAPPDRERIELHIAGDGGELHIMNPLAPQRGHRLRGHFSDGSSIDESCDTRPSYFFQLIAFEKVLSGTDVPLTAGDDAVNNMKAVDAVYQAAGMRGATCGAG